jgi:hypothetical protein
VRAAASHVQRRILRAFVTAIDQDQVVRAAARRYWPQEDFEEPPMRFRGLLAVSSLMTLGTMPFAAVAHGPDKAADACIRAFVDTYVPKDRAVRVRKHTQALTSSGIHARRYDFDLSARLRTEGGELVTARCVASANGQVISLEG